MYGNGGVFFHYDQSKTYVFRLYDTLFILINNNNKKKTHCKLHDYVTRYAIDWADFYTASYTTVMINYKYLKVFAHSCFWNKLRTK